MGRHAARRRRSGLRTAGLTGLAVLLVLAVAAGGLWLGGWRPSRAVAAGSAAAVVSHPTPTPSATPARHRQVHLPALSLGDAGNHVLRLQQLLAQTGYLPLRFVPLQPRRQPTPTFASPLTLRPGIWSWRFSHTPKTLRALWRPGQYTVAVQGAVMTFEYVHGMTTDGVAGPAVWKALLKDARHGRRDPHPYSYVYVSQALPERLTLWKNGRTALVTPANTGIPQAPTQPGTWPVYLRFISTTMSGTNPNGTHYSDPGVPWVSYFHGGDAVHGFLRASYGFPQSLGCVELPYAQAKVAFGDMTYGTLVTVGP